MSRPPAEAKMGGSRKKQEQARNRVSKADVSSSDPVPQTALEGSGQVTFIDQLNDLLRLLPRSDCANQVSTFMRTAEASSFTQMHLHSATSGMT